MPLLANKLTGKKVLVPDDAIVEASKAIFDEVKIYLNEELKTISDSVKSSLEKSLYSYVEERLPTVISKSTMPHLDELRGKLKSFSALQDDAAKTIASAKVAEKQLTETLVKLKKDITDRIEEQESNVQKREGETSKVFDDKITKALEKLLTTANTKLKELTEQREAMYKDLTERVFTTLKELEESTEKKFEQREAMYKDLMDNCRSFMKGMQDALESFPSPQINNLITTPTPVVNLPEKAITVQMEKSIINLPEVKAPDVIVNVPEQKRTRLVKEITYDSYNRPATIIEKQEEPL